MEHAASPTLSESPATNAALPTHNWNEEWKLVQTLRQRSDNAEFWNKRAATFGSKDYPNPYVTRFLELADIKPGETVFDMGCGTGALSIPLGEAGHEVLAADFSCGMLGIMQNLLSERNITSVTPKLMSWDDDWQAHGMTSNMVDVSVASRSIAVHDLEQALLRLTDVSRRRVCITIATGASPRANEHVLEALGLSSLAGRDYLYAFNILADNGIKAEVSYIVGEKHDTFASYEEAYDLYAKMVRSSEVSLMASKHDIELAIKKLETWLPDQLVENERAGELDSHGEKEGALRLARPRTITWAFLSWNK